MLFFFLCAAFALFPEKVLYGAQSGLAICLNNVIPSLLPFLLLSSCLIKSNFSRPMGYALSKVITPITGLSSHGCICLLTGLTGGYGSGAQAVKECYSERSISKKEAEALLPICNNAGPLFVIGTVGINFLLDKKYGILLYITQIITALICSALFYECRKAAKSSIKEEWEYYNKNKPSVGRLIVDAATASGNAIVSVCVFVISFSAVMEFFPKNDFFLLSAFFEVTRGCADASRYLENPLPFISSILSWGGMSVHFQANALTNGELSLKKYYFVKLTSAIISYFVTYFLCNKKTGFLFYIMIALFLTGVIYRIKHLFSLKLLRQP